MFGLEANKISHCKLNMKANTDWTDLRSWSIQCYTQCHCSSFSIYLQSTLVIYLSEKTASTLNISYFEMIDNDDLTRLFSTAEEELFVYNNEYNLLVHQKVKLLLQFNSKWLSDTLVKAHLYVQVLKQWEKKVRSASSLEELLRLADFPDWKLWKCRLRLQQPDNPSSPTSLGSHRSTRYAAESYSLEILKGWTSHVPAPASLVFTCCHGAEYCLISNSSHRRRVAADAVHAEGDMRWCGKGARHGPLNVFQATLRVCLQVCLTLLGMQALWLDPVFQSYNLTAFLSHLTSKLTLTVKQNVNRVTAQQFSICWDVLSLKERLDWY